MSRCFPFPPPGYERKLRVDDGNLLAKEKIKEKKHKKDKEKEKKERKEKDKERNKEKQREKTKEKKVKRKHKAKDKKKDKDQSRDAKRFRGEGHVEKVGSSSPQSSQLTGGSSAHGLGGTSNYVDGATANQTVISSNGTSQGRGELLDRVVPRNNGFWSEGKVGLDPKANGQRDNIQTRFPKVAIVCNLSGADQRRVGTVRAVERAVDKPTKEKEKVKNHRRDQKGEKKGGIHKHKDGKVQAEIKDTTSVQALGQRIGNENGAIGSRVVAKVDAPALKRAESIRKVANGNATYSLDPMEASKFANGVRRMEDGERGNYESRSPNVAFVPNSKGLEQKGGEMVGPLNVGKKGPVQGAERNTYGGSGLFNQEKKIPSKDEGRNTTRDEEKVKQGGDCIIKLSRLGESGKESTDNSERNTLEETNKSAAKRKAPEANGFFRGNEVRPSKLLRTISSRSPIGDGRNLPQCPMVTLSALKQAAANSLKLENKGQKANGRIGVHESPLGSTKPPSAVAKAETAMGAHESLVGSTNPPSSDAKVNRVMGVQKSCSSAQKSLMGSSTKSLTNPKYNGVMGAQELPIGSSKPSSSVVKANGMIVPQQSPVGPVRPPAPKVEANGTISAHGLPLDSNKHPSTHKKPKKHKEKSSSKPPPPHPDTRYLSQILSIPKMDEWSGFDDQAWLFENLSKETRMGSSCTGEGDLQVWAKAVHIEPADVYALPYVIPY